MCCLLTVLLAALVLLVAAPFLLGARLLRLVRRGVTRRPAGVTGEAPPGTGPVRSGPA